MAHSFFQVQIYCFFLKFYIVSYSNFSHRKIPSIVNRLMCFLFTVYYKGIISFAITLVFY
ncbi:hypothetical protein CN680_21400 [Bacillus pseudomycoides]|uniref:Uncharacterized protein n=1 Tax=Bacillus pseudomycoides TaxID=64104 RepID=A0A2C3YA90_9BACI|nr:hypothetical protein CN620_12540 [Bacillus pseudomycoides]PEJ72617.1 hypothetical protein CN680_21400 [Bacillus pseudomycoides]PEM66912.1 hypothetical protein CN613_20660 [Bacillus pseudomycoides]PHB53229.1 hypothetical protein COE83_00010 [Bacillus pseudomycoides]